MALPSNGARRWVIFTSPRHFHKSQEQACAAGRVVSAGRASRCSDRPVHVHLYDRLARKTSERHDHTAPRRAPAVPSGPNQPTRPPSTPATTQTHTPNTHTKHTHATTPPKPHQPQTKHQTTQQNPTPTTKPTTTKPKNISTRVRISREEGGEKGERKEEERGKGKGREEERKRKISAHGFEPRTAVIAQSGLIGSVTIERVKVASCPAQKDTCTCAHVRHHALPTC